MIAEVLSHRVNIERIDSGSSLARLEQPEEPDSPLAPEAVLALAHRSCGAAIEGIAIEAGGAVRYTPTGSTMTHIREGRGAATAAALVERELPSHVADDIRRNGNTHARVNVAVVDADGDAVALGTFEFFISR